MGVVTELPCTSQIPQIISQFNDQCVDSLLIGKEVTKEQVFLPYIFPQPLVN